MTGLPGAEPPDMAAASGAPLDEVRAGASRARTTSAAFAPPSAFREVLDEATRKAIRAHAAVEARMPEVMAGLMARERLLSAGLAEDELEWIVPTAYGWGEPGQEGNQLYGIRIRAVEGIDHLYLAATVKP